MEQIETEALDILTTIQGDVRSLVGGMQAFAYSFDEPDRWMAEAVRRKATSLAKLVAHDPALVARCRIALYWACSGDDYGTREVAGRFAGACERIRIVAAIGRHPRAEKFGGLVRALSGKTYTKAQIELGRKLAAEVA